MKKFSMFFITLVMFFSIFTVAVNASNVVTMYAPDGRSINVNSWEVDAYKNVGWYENINDVRITMYAPDGRTIQVWKSEVDAYINVGWYEDINDAKVTMYAPGGRTIQVWESEIDTYRSVGWYPAEIMFALDGRTIDIPGYQVEEYKRVGWYTYHGYLFHFVEIDYNEYWASGDYMSALQVISIYQDLFWETEYESRIMNMKHTAMDVIRNNEQQPLVIQDYIADEDGLDISFCNVSYKDIIAFRFTCDTYDIFGDIIEYSGDMTYIVEDAYIPSGVSEAYFWDNEEGIKWMDNFSMLTIVYSDGTIWRR